MAKGQYPRTDLIRLKTKLAFSEKRVTKYSIAHQEALNESATIRAEIARLEQEAK